MHELGLIASVVDAVKPVAIDNHATRIKQINLRIGEMTEVIEDALMFSFDVLAEDEPLLENCKLNVEFNGCKSVCGECGITFEHDRFHRVCPACGSNLTRLIDGNNMDIASIEIEN